MFNSVVTVNFGKMGGTILAVLLNLLILSTGVLSTCVHVPNDDMVEYSCVAGRPSDLYAIPEQVEKLRIANMSVPRITRNTFSRFGHDLLVLTCSYCGITEIDDDAFVSLQKLEQLRLENNRLREVRASWFEGMNELTYLDFNYNEIENIEDGVYQKLPRLVDFRISGNRLQCINADAMSRLDGLKRLFLSKNPNFQCPNAVSKFLENRDITVVKDPEWRSIPRDFVPSSSYEVPSTPGYHEKLVSQITEDTPHEDREHATEYPPDEPSQAPPISVYPNRWLPATSTTPYPQQEWSPPVATTATAARETPSSMPSSYPTRGWHTTESAAPLTYPTSNWPIPAPSNYPPYREQPEWHQQPESHEETEEPTTLKYDRENLNEGGIYGQTNYYPPVVSRTPAYHSKEDQRIPYDNYPRYDEEVTPAVHATPPPPPIEWVGNSAEILTETDYAPYMNEPQRQTSPPAMSTYRPVVRDEIPVTTQRPATMQDSNPSSEHSKDAPQSKDLDKYQAVEEPETVTIPSVQNVDQSPPKRVDSSTSNLGSSVAIVAICVLLRPLANVM